VATVDEGGQPPGGGVAGSLAWKRREDGMDSR
jgi:hypothetical protein